MAEFGKDTIIWFVEDRLKTLLSVQKQPDLKEVELFLADWGYNTQKERDSVVQHPPINLLSSAQFCQDFYLWKWMNLEFRIENLEVVFQGKIFRNTPQKIEYKINVSIQLSAF